MAKTILQEILETLDTNQRKKFKYFLLMMGNNDSDLIRIYDYILVNFNNYPSLKEISHTLFNNANSKNVSNKLSAIKKQVEKFLATQTLLSKNHLTKALYHEACIKNELFAESKRIRSKILTLRLDDQFDPFNSYLTVHKILHDAYFSESDFKYTDGTKLLNSSRSVLNDHLEFISKYHKIEEMNRTELDLCIEDSELFKADKWREHHSKYLLILELLRELIENRSLIAFSSLMSSIKYEKLYFPIEILALSIHHLELFAIKQIKQGDNNFIESLFEIYSIGLRLDLFKHKGFISSRRFGNMIDAACGFDNVEWGENLLKSRINEVESKLRNETELLANCQLLFASGKFDKCLFSIEDLSHSSLDHKLRYRWYKSACLFELKRFDELDNFLDAFRLYITRQRKNLSSATWEGLNNFIKTLSLIKNGSNRTFIIQKTNKMKNVIFRKWLMNKIEGLP